MDLLLQCKVCGKTGELMVCTGCEEVFYCSRECQVKDWASHKLWCKTRQAQIAREKQLAQQAQQTPPSEPSPSSASQPSPRPAPADAAAAPQQQPSAPQQQQQQKHQQQPTEAAAAVAETPQPPPKPKPEPETPTPKPQTAAETPSPSPNPESAQQQQSKPAQWMHSSTPALPPQPSHGPPQPGLSSPSPYAGSGDMSSGTMSSGAVEEDVDEFGDDFGDDLRTRRGWQHKMRRFVSETSTAAQRRLGSLKDSVQEMHIGEKTRRAVTNVTEAVKSAARKPGEQSASSSSAGQQPPLSSSSPPSSTDSTPGLAPSSLAANATTNALLAPPGPGDTDAVFGVSFELAVRRSGHICKELPDVLVLCCSYLMRHGLEEEGLFRLSGSLREVAVLRGAFQKGDTPNMEEIGDPHVVTGLLKLWFRELPESLFERRPGAPTDPLPGGPYKTLLGQLHDGRRKAIQVLFELLSKVAANSTKNKMNPNNLAIVFSPTLQAANDIVVNLITNYSALFDQSTGPKLPPAWPNLSGAKPLPHAPVAEEAQRQQRKPLPPPPKAKPLPPLPPAQQPQPQPPQTDLLL